MVSEQRENTRDRILRATLELLSEQGRGAVSTRAVSAAAAVQPQTIYRQFGDMDGLLAEAASEGFRTYLASKSSRTKRDDPVDDLRDGWDLHVEFGLENPALYLLMYGDPTSTRESAAAAQTKTILRELVEAVARAGRLRVDIESAVAMIQSTGIGVVITLIGLPTGDAVAATLSSQVREAVIAGMVAPGESRTSVTSENLAASASASASASALRALLPTGTTDLTPGENLILDELLTRISRPV